jgi:hypothetical protein
MMEDNKTFQSSDFWLSSFLKAKGLKLIKIKKEGKRSVFIFEDRADREELIREFYNNGLVAVGNFKTAVQDLKSLIHNF